MIMDICYGYIYITTNMNNGIKYIGMKRLEENHENYLGSGKTLKKAIKKYGSENFFKEIVAFAITEEELCNLEIEFIKNHNACESRDYYNIHSGGKGGDTKAGYTDEQKRAFGNKVSNSLRNSEKLKARMNSEEYREKQRLATLSRDNHMKLEKYRKIFSEKFKGDKNPMYGVRRFKELNPMYGKKRSKELKDKQSKRMKGKNNPRFGVKGEDNSTCKCVKLIDNNDIIKVFPSVTLCGEFVGKSSGQVSNWILGRRKGYLKLGYKSIEKISKEEYIYYKQIEEKEI